MKTVMVAAAAWNWAESHRMGGIGREFRRRGYRVYALGEGLYGGELSKSLERVCINYDNVWFTRERIARMMQMDRFGNDYCAKEELERITDAELSLLEKLRPDAVVTGYRTTLTLSCRIAKIPLVWALSAVVSPMYYTLGLAGIPEDRKFAFAEGKISGEKADRLYDRLVMSDHGTSGVWNEALRTHGLPEMKSDLSIFQGNLNLLTDIPELFPQISGHLQRGYFFCGPLWNRHSYDVKPKTRPAFSESRRRIFVSMGSSGSENIFLTVLRALKKTNFIVLAATAGILREEDLEEFGSRFFFQKAFPHLQTAQRADLCIIHGGQGTMYTTALAGRPFIGIPMFGEQQYNLENIGRFGSSIMILKKELSEEKILECIWRILSDSSYAEAAAELKNIVKPYYTDPMLDADRRAADIIEENLF